MHPDAVQSILYRQLEALCGMSRASGALENVDVPSQRLSTVSKSTHDMTAILALASD